MAELTLAQRNARKKKGPARLIHALALSLVALFLTGCLEDATDTTFAFGVCANFADKNTACTTSGGAATSSAVLSFAYIDTGADIVVIHNGGTAALAMATWTLEAQQSGDFFTFPDPFTLFAGGFVWVRKGTSTNDAENLYWVGTDIWSPNDTATLRDSSTNVVLVCTFTSSDVSNC